MHPWQCCRNYRLELPISSTIRGVRGAVGLRKRAAAKTARIEVRCVCTLPVPQHINSIYDLPGTDVLVHIVPLLLYHACVVFTLTDLSAQQHRSLHRVSVLTLHLAPDTNYFVVTD